VRWPDDAAGALRVSLHVFSTHDDIEKLIQGLQLALR
jgi:selenocysteine lyase/cysteine desulfurase